MSASAEVLEQSVEELIPGESAPALEAQAAEPQAGRFFYGWVMLPLATLVMIGTSPGQSFGIAFFNDSFRSEFGLSATGLSASYMLATVLASLTLPAIGGWVDRFGLRRSVLFGLAGMAAACVFASLTTGVVTLFLAFVSLRMLGPGTLVLLANNTLANWFDRRLGTASSLMQVSMAGAWALVPAGIVVAIDNFGWRGAYLTLAAVLALGMLPLMFFVYRQSPDDLGQTLDGKRLPKNPKHQDTTPSSVRSLDYTVQEAKQFPAYWILLAATGLWAMLGTGLIFHLTALFQSAGLTKADGTWTIGAMAIVMGSTQLLGGVLADRLAVRWLLVTSLGMMALGCGLLAMGTGSTLFAGYISFGCAQGVMTIVAGTAWARFFGREHLGRIRGVSLTVAVATSAIGPFLMGLSVDYAGGFGPALTLYAALAAALAIAGFWTHPPEQKQAVPVA